MKKPSSTKWVLAFLAVSPVLAVCAENQDEETEPAVFSGSIGGGIAWTDNLYLQPAPNDTDEWTYVLQPKFMVNYDTQRISTALRYEYDWYRYKSIGETQRFERYDGYLTGIIVPEMFQIEVGAYKDQAIVDPNGSIPSSNLPTSGNLADRDEYYVNPRFDQTIGNIASFYASYRYSDITYDKRELQSSINKELDVGLNSASSDLDRGATWSLTYGGLETTYDMAMPWKYQNLTGQLGYWTSTSLRLFAAAGLESPWDDPTNSDLEDQLYEVGFEVKRGDRLRGEFAIGERSFGASARAELEIALRSGQFTLSYSETPKTTGMSRFRPGMLNPDDPLDLLEDPRDPERYIAERFEALLATQLRRTNISVTVYSENRTERFTASGLPSEDEEQRGIRAEASMQVGARTELSVRAAAIATQREEAGKEHHRFAEVKAQFSLGRSIALQLAYNYTSQKPEESGMSRDYDANVASFFVVYSF